MKIKMVGQAIVATSGVKTEQIKLLSKFKPSALKLVDTQDGKKEEVCNIAVGTSASLSKFGAVFNATDANGFAQLTLSAPVLEDAAKKEAYIKDNFGYALLNMNKLEAQVLAVIDDTATEFEAMSDLIEVE